MHLSSRPSRIVVALSALGHVACSHPVDDAEAVARARAETDLVCNAVSVSPEEAGGGFTFVATGCDVSTTYTCIPVGSVNWSCIREH
jgi:hypothetical protein